MKAFTARYVLPSGARGTLTLIATSARAAWDAAWAALGDVRFLSVRPA